MHFFPGMLRARSQTRYRHRGQREYRRSRSRHDKRGYRRSRSRHDIRTRKRSGSRSKPQSRRERGKGNMMYCAARPLHGFSIFDDSIMSISSSPERSEPSTTAIAASKDADSELDVKIEPQEPDASAQGGEDTEQLLQGEQVQDQRMELNSKEDQGATEKKQGTKTLCAEDDAENDAAEKHADHAQQPCDNSEQDPISPVKFDGYEPTDSAFPQIDGNEFFDMPKEIQESGKDATMDGGDAPQGTDGCEPMDEAQKTDEALPESSKVPCAENDDPSALQKEASKVNECESSDLGVKPQLGDSFSAEQNTTSPLKADGYESMSGELKPECEDQSATLEVPPGGKEEGREMEKPIETNLAPGPKEELPRVEESEAMVCSEKQDSLEENKDNAIKCGEVQ